MNSRLMSALMPMHATLLAADENPGGGIGQDPAPVNHFKLECLRGHPELINIARFDTQLALTLKALLDSTEDADFNSAHKLAESITQRLRFLILNTRSDDAGIVRR